MNNITRSILFYMLLLLVSVSAMIATGSTWDNIGPIDRGVYGYPADRVASIGLLKCDFYHHGEQHIQGSAVLIHPLYAVTAAHCCLDDVVEVMFGGEWYSCEVVGLSLADDWALLRLDMPVLNIEVMPMSNAEPTEGEWFYALGWGSGDWTCTVLRYWGGDLYGPLVGGMSGGAILDWSGCMVGVNSTGNGTTSRGWRLGDVAGWVAEQIQLDQEVSLG
jgi:hypothetical protein